MQDPSHLPAEDVVSGSDGSVGNTAPIDYLEGGLCVEGDHETGYCHFDLRLIGHRRGQLLKPDTGRCQDTGEPATGSRPRPAEQFVGESDRKSVV